MSMLDFLDDVSRSDGSGIESAILELALQSLYGAANDNLVTNFGLLEYVVLFLRMRKSVIDAAGNRGAVQEFEQAVDYLKDIVIPWLFGSVDKLFRFVTYKLSSDGFMSVHWLLDFLENASAVGLFDIFWDPSEEAANVIAKVEERVASRGAEIEATTLDKLARYGIIPPGGLAGYQREAREELAATAAQLAAMKRRFELRHAYTQMSIAAERGGGGDAAGRRARARTEPPVERQRGDPPLPAIGPFFDSIAATTYPNASRRALHEYTPLVASFLGGRRRRVHYS